MLCREYGAACAVTEMVSAKGLVYYSPGTKDLLATCPKDSPLVVQLFGSEPDMFAQAMDKLLEAGFSWFDLNCGCSVPKVVKTGAGAALLRTPELLLEIAKIMVAKAGPGRVGIKLRTGWCAEETPVFDIAKSLEDHGIAWLALHPRHARQGYSGAAKWALVAALKQPGSPSPCWPAATCSATPGQARQCLAEPPARTGSCSPAGALGDPTIFERLLANVFRRRSALLWPGHRRS